MRILTRYFLAWVYKSRRDERNFTKLLHCSLQSFNMLSASSTIPLFLFALLTLHLVFDADQPSRRTSQDSTSQDSTSSTSQDELILKDLQRISQDWHAILNILDELILEEQQRQRIMPRVCPREALPSARDSIFLMFSAYSAY